MAATQLSRALGDLVPSIRAQRPEIERGRQLPSALVQELCATGIFSLGIPRTMGGPEATPREMLEAVEQLAAADGSVGWCAMVGIANSVSAGYMNERGAREMFADPTLPTAGIAGPAGAATPVDGGFRVTGRWPFASGITHCDWLWAGCVVMEHGRPRMTPNGPEIVHACMPVREVVVHDTWFVSGLSGTGSHDVSAADVFVPGHRVFALLDPAGHRKDPLYRFPIIGLFVSQVAAVSLGIARAALDELIELAQTKVPTLSTVVLADKPVTHVELAHAEASLSAARAFLYASVDALWQVLVDGGEPTPRQIAENRLAAAHATDTGASVARAAGVLAGGGSIYAASSMQRHMRDAEALTHHFTVSRHVWEDAGRVLLGRKPTVPVF